MRHTDTYFYAPPANIVDNEIIFDQDESEHITRVLRLDDGDIITVVDGEGHGYEAELAVERRGRVWGKIIGNVIIENETKTSLTLGVGLIKPANLEIAVNMAVQLGAKGFWFFKPDHIATEWDEERIAKFSDRIRRIAINAMKQSKRATLPKIIPVAPIDELIRLRKMFEAIFFAHPFGLPSFDYRSFKEGEAYLLLVGPEGDFSAREKEFLREISAIPISLGPRRLRTETAAVAFLVKALCVSREI